MRALVCRGYGPPNSLRVEEVASPKAGTGEVLISVKAAGVNFPDLLMIQNKYQHKPPLPFSPGYEVAGVVSEVGEGVTGIKPGDAGVAMIRWGGFAEQAVVEAARFWPVPSSIGFESAAAFPLAYGTSYHALKDRGGLKAGETLLVLGASGGVGLAAVQLGKLMGARVIAGASSPEKLEVCKNFGADEVIDYASADLRKELARLSERGVDVTLDPIGSIYSEAAMRGMAWGGRHLVVGFAAGEIPKLPLNLPLLKGCAVVGVAWDSYARRDPPVARALIAELTAWIVAGKLKPALAAKYPLAQAATALEHLAQRRIAGKAVVII